MKLSKMNYESQNKLKNSFILFLIYVFNIYFSFMKSSKVLKNLIKGLNKVPTK